MECDRTPGTGSFLDRSRWLILVGLLEILLGGICGVCGLLLFIFNQFFKNNPATETLTRGGMLAINALALLAAAALLVWLGVGTMRARRWSRDLMLVAAWVWLVVGVASLVPVFILLPVKLREMSGPDQVPLAGGEIVLIMGVLGVLFGFLYVVLPGFFVLFYSSKNVRKTFENRDSSAPWTSKCPISVLTLCQFLACCAIAFPVSAIYADTVPVGSRIVTGVLARLILAALTLIYGYLTWAVYKLKPHAWWVNFFLTILSFIWLFTSYREAGLADLVSSLGITSQLDWKIPGRVLSGFTAAICAGYVIFLLLIKKYFVIRSSQTEEKNP